ncbi:hypothetical protein E2C01_072062 [Portunus trituberculatus]|uniref:Uncharacterized protein n=1 Tax=Portunus trituberculatus TaxID=210409 RepID=A0A5B7IA40_PORTR|nr:hypothetical protein [Portunus trituberculatus]
MKRAAVGALTERHSNLEPTPCNEGNTSRRVAAITLNDKHILLIFLLYNSFLVSRVRYFSLTNSNILYTWRPRFQSFLRDVTT